MSPYIPNLIKASLTLILYNQVTVVKYRKLESGHSIKVLIDSKPVGSTMLPIHEKITISKLSICTVNIVKAKNKFRYENDNIK